MKSLISQDPTGLAGGVNVYQYAPNPAEWIGDSLAYESSGTGATQYVCEPETFIPLAQYVTAQPVAGIETPVWREGEPYVPEKDPMQRVPERQSDAHLFYYHCD